MYVQYNDSKFQIVNIIIYNEQDSLMLASDQVEKVVKFFLQEENCRYDEVSIHFVDTSFICDLHAKYFDDDSPTDCISFPMDEDDSSYYRVLGEVFICPETAKLYATEHHLDPYTETTLYLIHGLLHLLGFDDINEEDRQKMRLAEKKHMQKIIELGLELKAAS